MQLEAPGDRHLTTAEITARVGDMVEAAVWQARQGRMSVIHVRLSLDRDRIYDILNREHIVLRHLIRLSRDAGDKLIISQYREALHAAILAGTRRPPKPPFPVGRQPRARVRYIRYPWGGTQESRPPLLPGESPPTAAQEPPSRQPQGTPGAPTQARR